MTLEGCSVIERAHKTASVPEHLTYGDIPDTLSRAPNLINNELLQIDHHTLSRQGTDLRLSF